MGYLKEKLIEMEPQRIAEKGKVGFICPKCGEKCWTVPVGEGWVCECLNCYLVFDED